ncbi:MAG: hypothetical protein PHV34_20975 [Verrucomicrobiae bacterium]|nr:hypothetical protein [Verrucomicrobiae bacterium]
MSDKSLHCCFSMGMSMALAVAGLLVSCNFSRPPAEAGSKKPPERVIKFVPYSKDKALHFYFCLADSATNQVAWGGVLKVQVYRDISMKMGNAGTGIQMKHYYYDNSFSLGATNFHWESMGAFFKIRDLTCRFKVPYASFQKPVQKGQVVKVRMEFKPDETSTVLAVEKNVSLY